MSEENKNLKIKEGSLGEVEISADVVSMIAGLAATEVEGIVSMNGNITYDLVAKLGVKHLSKGVRVFFDEDKCRVDVAVNIGYGYSIPEVSESVQDKVKTTVENMTGLDVSEVNVKVASVELKKQKKQG